jgi:hypothetical protein
LHGLAHPWYAGHHEAPLVMWLVSTPHPAREASFCHPLA